MGLSFLKKNLHGYKCACKSQFVNLKGIIALNDIFGFTRQVRQMTLSVVVVYTQLLSICIR